MCMSGGEDIFYKSRLSQHSPICSFALPSEKAARLTGSYEAACGVNALFGGGLPISAVMGSVEISFLFFPLLQSVSLNHVWYCEK